MENKYFKKYLNKIDKRIELLEYKKDFTTTTKQIDNICDEKRVLFKIKNLLETEIERTP